MENTLKNKYGGKYLSYLTLMRRVCLLNPGHGALFVPGVGVIESEWTWCANGIEMLKHASICGEHWERYARPLLKYIRHKENQK